MGSVLTLTNMNTKQKTVLVAGSLIACFLLISPPQKWGKGVTRINDYPTMFLYLAADFIASGTAIFLLSGRRRPRIIDAEIIEDVPASRQSA